MWHFVWPDLSSKHHSSIDFDNSHKEIEFMLKYDKIFLYLIDSSSLSKISSTFSSNPIADKYQWNKCLSCRNNNYDMKDQ